MNPSSAHTPVFQSVPRGMSGQAAMPTVAGFTAAANAVCTEAEGKIGPIVGDIIGKGDAATDADRTAAVTALLAAVRAEISGLAAVPAPVEKAVAYAAMIDSAKAAAATVEKQGAGFWLTQDDPFADTNAKAKALGLDACAGAPS